MKAARCCWSFVGLSIVFSFASAVPQRKVEQASTLAVEDSTRSHNVPLNTDKTPASLEANAYATLAGVEGKSMLSRDRNLVHGHVNNRGIYVADAKVGVGQEGDSSEPHGLGASAAQTEDIAHKIHQPANFMRRELNHGARDLPAGGPDGLDDQWLDLQPAAFEEAEASTIADMDESFNWWDRRRRRRRYNCKWTQWSGWKACSVNCGAGQKQRDRQTNGPHWGGKVCAGAKSEFSTCNLQNCAVDCEWNGWGAWGPCSKTCGGGARARQRGALPFTNRDGGALCDKKKMKNGGVCNSFSCPVPCTFGAWSLWGGCSKTCGTGLKRRTRAGKGPLHGGAPCKGEVLLQDKCNAYMCPVDCAWSAWGGWGSCSRTCGGGIRLRERAYSSQAENGGKSCPGSPAEVLACNIEECPIDCVWASWHQPGPCTKTCGGGAFKRHRAKFQEVAFGGKTCTGPNTEIGPCNVEPCSVDCLYDEWQPFTECTASCGGGVHRAKRNGTKASHGGLECSEENSSLEEACNTVECPSVTVKGRARQSHHNSAVVLLAVAVPLLWLRT